MSAAALADVVADLAATEDSEAFAARWAHPPAPLESVPVRPWEDAVGGADARFRAGHGPTLGELEARFGPLQPVPRLPGGTQVRTATWRPEGSPTSVKILLYDAPADGPIDVVVLRRDVDPDG